MTRRIAYLLVFGLLFIGNLAIAADSDKELAALAAAEKWLVVVDAEKYADSWKRAAALFKKSVQPDQWERSMRAARETLGGVVSRKMLAKFYTTALPGAPDGEYVVIQFDTSFKNKRSAVETVTPMMDEDGVWRVSGYYVK